MTHLGLGYIYHIQGKYEQSVALYQHVIDLLPDKVYGNTTIAYAHSNLAVFYRRQGKVEEALSESQQVVKVNPKEGYAHHNLACVYSLKNEPQLTIESLQKAIDLDKSYIEYSKTGPDLENIRQTPEYQQLIDSY